MYFSWLSIIYVVKECSGIILIFSAQTNSLFSCSHWNYCCLCIIPLFLLSFAIFYWRPLIDHMIRYTWHVLHIFLGENKHNGVPFAASHFLPRCLSCLLSLIIVWESMCFPSIGRGLIVITSMYCRSRRTHWGNPDQVGQRIWIQCALPVLSLGDSPLLCL